MGNGGPRQFIGRYGTGGREKGRSTHPIVRELDSRNHDDAPVPGVPVIVADERTLGSRALSRRELGHAELDVRVRVHRGRVEDGDAVPARLDLDGQVALEAVRRLHVAEDGLEGRVLECGAVHVTRDPAVGKTGSAAVTP